MAIPQPTPVQPEDVDVYKSEVIFRYPHDGGPPQVLPPTRENLLDPRPEDKVTQSNPHERILGPLKGAIRPELEEREGERWGVFSDLLLLLKEHPGFDWNVSPDVIAVRGIDDPNKVDESLDPITEGLEIPLVIEVVSTKYKDSREKDEVDNVPVFDRLGVEDYVRVYPEVESRGEKLRLEAHTRNRHGAFVDNPPDRLGRIRIRCLGWRIFVDDEGKLALQDIATGQRIRFPDDERRLRRSAEQRAEQEKQRAEQEKQRVEQERQRAEQERQRAEQAERHNAETLILILESRRLDLTEADRRRILDCRDADTLRRWTLAAVTVEAPSELWNV